MNNTTTCNIERIIAKIDNDFNPDSSDWIPRVAAWCIDAVSMLGLLLTEKKKFKLPVEDRKASSDCPLDMKGLKVFDENGCEVERSDESFGCGFTSSTGGCGSFNDDSNAKSSYELTPDTITVETDPNNSDYYTTFVETRNSKDYPARYNVHSGKLPRRGGYDRKFRLADPCTIEINYDGEFIYVEYEAVKTEVSETYGCELPVIQNNGLLIEAVTYYCMFKMLCRGYKHPVFNLSASQYGSNPFFQWNQLKDEAKRSATIDKQKEADTKIFRSNLYIQTFDPKR